MKISSLCSTNDRHTLKAKRNLDITFPIDAESWVQERGLWLEYLPPDGARARILS
jgi:hypothetical protein